MSLFIVSNPNIHIEHNTAFQNRITRQENRLENQYNAPTLENDKMKTINTDINTFLCWCRFEYPDWIP